jgi:protoporphyrinogen oxidase
VNARVAIVGAGITGLTAAYTLLKAGVQVTVVESRPSVGGLAASHDFGDFHWDRFYHCILTSDASLLGLLNDLGLQEKLRWRKTEVGFYCRDALHTMTRPTDLLRFPCLSLWAKIRFGLGIVYAARMCNGAGLEAVPLKDWIVSVFGTTVYRELWEPLLRCKLGDMRSQASAAFLWATIRRLYSTRSEGVKKEEQLGYVEGGYRVVMDRLVDEIRAMGGVIQTAVGLECVEPTEDGIGLTAHRTFREFDACIMTVPAPVILAYVPALSEEYRARLTMPQYLGMVCVVLVLSRQLSPYYLTNVTQQAPFTGIVEMTNLIDGARETNGHALVYLPKYTSPSDRLFDLTDKEVWERFAPTLFKIHPLLRYDEILKIQVFRERHVQPVPTLNYSAQAPTVVTGIPHLFVANTTQIVNDTLNNNAMVGIARNACKIVLSDLQKQARLRAEKARQLAILEARATLEESEVIRDDFDTGRNVRSGLAANRPAARATWRHAR